MLALITERLQNQRLEDIPSQHPSNIQLITAQGISFTGAKPVKSPDSNKKIWPSSHDGKKRCVNRHHAVSDGKNLSGQSYGAQLFLCFHNRPVQTCAMCSSQNHSSTPPKKKHCRSLSIPADTPTTGCWKPEGTRLWKPIAVSPMVLHPKQHKVKPYSPSFSRDLRPSGARSSLGCITPQDVGGFVSGGDLKTPPESPVPRPASASSGYCEGSFSPIGAPWLECSPSRSYTEGRISARHSAGSTPSVSASINSMPSSPCRHGIPRCRSQPSVLHDRKCGLKRRRDYDRPTLDFRKMAETAYPSDHHLTPPVTRFSDYLSVSTTRPSRFREDLYCAMNLLPIASSPLDTEIPLKAMESPKASPIKEMGRFSRLALSEDSGCSEVEECEEGPEEGSYNAGAPEAGENTDLFPIVDLDVEEIESH